MRKTALAAMLFIAAVFPCTLLASPDDEIKEVTHQCRELAAKNLHPSRGMGQNEISECFFIAVICTRPEIVASLDNREKNNVREVARLFNEYKKTFSAEEVRQMEKLELHFLDKWEESTGQGEPYQGKELAALDAHLKSIWEKMLECLRKKDVDQALIYFSGQTRERYRKMFSALKDHLPEIAKEQSEIKLEKMNMARHVTYAILTVRRGQKYSFQLTFIREMDDEWRILHY